MSGEALFAICFVVLPRPTSFKVILAGGLLLARFLVIYRIRYYRQFARLWFLSGAMWFLNVTCYTTGLAIDACFRFRWPQDIGYTAFIFGGLIGTAYLTWRYYTPVMKPLLEADCHTGRFALDSGTFSLLVPPTFYEFKTPLLRKAAAILLPSSGALIAISAASGVHGGRKLLEGRDLGFGALSLFLAAGFVFAVTCAFYTYRWIRRWEQQTSRTMWIKGFEPQAEARR